MPHPRGAPKISDAHLTVLRAMPDGAWLSTEDVAWLLREAGHETTWFGGVPTWRGGPLAALLRKLRRVGWLRSRREGGEQQWQRVHDGSPRPPALASSR